MHAVEQRGKCIGLSEKNASRSELNNAVKYRQSQDDETIEMEGRPLVPGVRDTMTTKRAWDGTFCIDYGRATQVCIGNEIP